MNDGAAPLYWDWPACLYILSDSGKVLSRTPVDIRLSALTENKEIRTRTTVEAALLSRPGREAVLSGWRTVHRRPGGLSRHGRAAAGYPVRPV